MTPRSILEITIAGFHERLEKGAITCAGLVQEYLKRIEAYDKPTGLNSMVVVNPNAFRARAPMNYHPELI